MKKLLLALSTVFLSIISASAKDIVCGISEIDAPHREMEYCEYSDLYKFYASQGIQTGLMEYNMFSDNTSAEKLLAEMKKFQVVFLRTTDETVSLLNDAKRKKAQEAGKAIASYVEAGGGLILGVTAVRYPGHDDEKFWNLVMEPIGAHLTREGVADAKHLVKDEWKSGFFTDFYKTANITKHPVTNGISELFFPCYTYVDASGTPYVEYSDQWQILVKGEKDASTFLQDKSNKLKLDLPGTIASEPAIIAARPLGKGRIVCLTVPMVHTGQNWKKPTWSHIVEGKDGERLMKLLCNAFRWCAEPTQDSNEFGTWKKPEYKRIQFPEAVSFDAPAMNKPAQVTFHKIIFGAHSSYTDGASTVAEYAAAAKQAGLSGIVFADPLEKLTESSLKALKDDCAANTSEDFLALPGVEFTDGVGIRRYAAGNKVVWPDATPFKKGQYTYTIWDGERMLLYGHYMILCSFPTSAIIDYSQLETSHVRKENLWWFWELIPYVYDNGKLVADNRKELDFALRDLRRVSPLPFTRIHSAAEVAKAAEQEVLVGTNLSKMKDVIDKGQSHYSRRSVDASLCIGGNAAVLIRAWKGVNYQQDPRPLKTRGTQRTRLMFDVASENGIRDVKVIDGHIGKPIRVFDAKGAQDFSREFEMVHDRQYHVYLEVTDMNGNQAISEPYYIYDYKQSLMRCSDNLNILGPLGYWWHPDRPELLPAVKMLRNAEKLSVMGWDRAAADCPFPTARNCMELFLKDGQLSNTIMPDVSQFMRMDVEVSSGELQIVNSIIDEFAERCDTASRPGPAQSSPVRIMAKNPYVSVQERMYSPRDRQDFHIAWDNRRYLESIEDYDGSIQIFEGKVTVLKDMELSASAPVPIRFVYSQMEPYQSGMHLARKLLLKENSQDFTPEQTNVVSGELKPYEFAAAQQSMVGTIAIVPLSDNGWRYAFSARNGFMACGIGTPGETVKAGTEIPFRYATISIAGNENVSESIAERIEILRGNIPFIATIGKHVTEDGVFRMQADNHQALFTAGPAKPGIDWPFGVSGIEDNGCVAIFTTERPWFRFVPCTENGVAYFQESIDKANHIWCGNIFTADSPAINLTLVADGQDAGKLPFLELHNPTDKAIQATISSASGVPVFGGISFTVEIPAKDSIRHHFTNNELRKSVNGIADPALQNAAAIYGKKLGK